MDISSISSQSIFNSYSAALANEAGGESSVSDPFVPSDSGIQSLEDPNLWQAQLLSNTYTNQGALLSTSSSINLPLTLSARPQVPSLVQQQYDTASATQWQARAVSNLALNSSVLFSEDPLSIIQPSFGVGAQTSLLANYSDFKLQTPQLLQRYVNSLAQTQPDNVVPPQDFTASA